jgi:hypothetical protein
MKKNLSLFIILIAAMLHTMAQNTKAYPLPEYSNEICLVKTDSTTTLVRLEKGSAQMQTKVKALGMGGMDNGYEIEGGKSTVRLHSGTNLVFVLFTGETSSSSPESDSAMKANGIDPSMLSGAMSMFSDPSSIISLYNMRTDKGQRKVLLQSMGLMGMSKKTSTKYTLSIKKVKENYYEIKVDKPLPKGEYAFVMMDSQGMDQSYKLFAFGVD